MARIVAWLSAFGAIALALAMGAATIGAASTPVLVEVYALAPLLAPFGVRGRERGSLRAPGLIALAMGIEATSLAVTGIPFALFVAPVLLLCFATASAIEPPAEP
ncbi:MAG: hypothetical protein NVS1B1_01950 [Candidatus Limnocylindrales bacterium]